MDHTPVYVEITDYYPWDKPKLFFKDRSIVCSSLSPTGQYIDNVSWTAAMDIVQYLDCVRHEILAAP